MGWHYHLNHWITIDQNSRDPHSPDHAVNCGPACTAAMIRWQTGRHIDPEHLRLMAGDPQGEDTGTGIEIDQWAYSARGPGPGHIHVAFPHSLEALAWELYNALSGHHPIKVLQWFDESQSEGHWRVVHAGRFEDAVGMAQYLSGDPWTGDSIVQSIEELWKLFLGVIVVPLHPRL